MRLFLKILGFSLAFAAAIGAGYAIYAGFFAPPPQRSAEKPQKTAVASKTDKLKLVGDKTALAFWFNSKTNSVYLLDEEGKIYKSFGEDRLQEVNTQTLTDFNSLTSSPDGTKIVARFGYPLAETLAIFDTSTNTWERLPDGTFAAVFDSLSQKLAYLKNTASPSLNIVNLADKKTSEILKLQIADAEISWINPGEVYVYGKPSLSSDMEAWSINIQNKNIKKIALGPATIGLKFIDGENGGFRLARVNAIDTSLNLIHSSGADLLTIPFNTYPQKCYLSKNNVYCGVLNNANRVNFDDYLKEKVFSVDNIVSYNILTGEQKILLSADEVAVDVYNLVAVSGKLYFINRYDGKVYMISL